MAEFCYYNRNYDDLHISDCVTRAISLASELSYAQTRRKLRYTSKLLQCESSLCPTCYGFLIQEVLGGIPKNCDNMSVGEFADKHPIGTYLVRIQGHLTCVKDNKIMDIWNCMSRKCDLAWEIR